MKNQARTKSGKFKKADRTGDDPQSSKAEVSGDDPQTKAEEPQPKAEAPHSGDDPQSAKEQPRILTRVAGQRTKMARLQSHNLKTDEIGEPLPEFIEGVEENE